MTGIESLNRLMQWILRKLSGVQSETLLWENSNPTANFTAQTISIPNLAEYARIKVVFCGWVTASWEFTEEFERDTYIAGRLWVKSTNVMNATGREIKRNNEGLDIGDCYLRTVTSTGAATSIYNNNLVPLKIYGLKKVGGGGVLKSSIFRRFVLVRGCAA